MDDRKKKQSVDFLWDDYETGSTFSTDTGSAPVGVEEDLGDNFKENAAVLGRVTSNHSTKSYNWDYNEVGPKCASWDCRGLTRMQVRTYVKTLLEDGIPGEFVIRDKDSESGYALTAKLPLQSLERFATFLIGEEDEKVFIKGTPAWERFATMAELVEFYSSVERPSLGFKLSVPENLWGVSPTKLPRPGTCSPDVQLDPRSPRASVTASSSMITLREVQVEITNTNSTQNNYRNSQAALGRSSLQV